MNKVNIKTIEIDKPSVILLKDEYESLKETIEILSDNDLVKDISEALNEKKEDRLNHKDLFNE